MVTLLGACSNIIGISNYEIDSTLDDGSGGSTGTGGKNTGGSHAGSKNMSGGEPNMPVGGNDSGGTGVGGKNTGGSNTGGGPIGGAPAAGEPGTAGEPSTSGCKTALDCDDTIDCTTDTCSGAGTCVHTAKNNLCDSSLCETCQVGIGCVAGTMTTTQLLLDPGFDIIPVTADWDDSGSDGVNVVVNNAAQTPTKIAKFGPVAGNNPPDQQYSDLLQWVTIPVGTVALTLTGYYKLTTGTKAPKDDYLVTAFYETGEILPFTQFHSFEATVGPSTTWKSFSYSAPKADVAKMGGVDYTFDLVAHVWDTVFQFDSLQMNATVCQ